jgi:hypothetical protein
MKIYVFLTLFISFLSFSQEKTVEVIAVEYPPFTTLDRDDDGLAFKLLRKKILKRVLLGSRFFCLLEERLE